MSVQITPQVAARGFSRASLNKGFQPKALHVYEDEIGNILYWKIRLKHPDTGEKWIRPMHLNAEGDYELKEPVFLKGKPLYRLPRLVGDATSTVWLVEGEACVDVLEKLGILATTSGSVDNLASTDWYPLKKRNIIIWRDNDEAGLRYANALTALLEVLGCNIQWVEIEKFDLPPHGDCVDWLNLHPEATRENFETLPLILKEAVEPHQKLYVKESLPSRFSLNSQGVFYHFGKELRRVCSPLQVTAFVRDGLSQNWGRLLEFKDADGRLHRWMMPMEMLKGNGEELRGELLRLGLDIVPGQNIRQQLVEYIVSIQPEKRARVVHRTGWHEGVFILPHQTLGDAQEEIFYQSDVEQNDYQPLGTLEEWKQHIAFPSAGNSRLVLALSCAFAAMLLYPVSAESGGIHLIGESSTGKTTALRVAASVFGSPHYLHRWRTTTNGLEALAHMRTDTLLILDELSQVDPREAGENAYLLANGKGKARANKTGGAKKCFEWRILFLSAGEISLSQHMREAGKKAKVGQEVRLVDIPADAGKGLGIFETLHVHPSGAAFSKALMEASTLYYGTAAVSFLERVMTLKSTLPETIKDLMNQFTRKYLPTQASGQVHRVSERFALIAAAGELASHFEVTGWKEGEALESAGRCFNAWLERRGTHQNQERETILSQVRSFFETHGESRFSLWNDPHSRTLQRAGFRKSEEGETEFYVLPEAFRHEVCAGLDYRTVTQVLIEERWIKPSAEGTAYRREYLPGLGRTRCYVFTHQLWNLKTE